MRPSREPNPREPACQFCQIAAKVLESPIVLEDDLSMAFLDLRPVFPGHCLLIPKSHYETLCDLPEALIAHFFTNAQLLAQAVEEALGAEGTFVAINNKVSQSVPHLHLHVVPRRKGDGLRGFFWPRQRYQGATQMLPIQQAIRAAVNQLRSRNASSTAVRSAS